MAEFTPVVVEVFVTVMPRNPILFAAVELPITLFLICKPVIGKLEENPLAKIPW